MIRKNISYSWAILAILAFATPAGAEFVHQWNYNGFATDSVGSAPGTRSSNAPLVGDCLSVDGVQGSRFLTSLLATGRAQKTRISWISLNDHMRPAPIEFGLVEKALVAWVVWKSWTFPRGAGAGTEYRGAFHDRRAGNVGTIGPTPQGSLWEEYQ